MTSSGTNQFNPIPHPFAIKISQWATTEKIKSTQNGQTPVAYFNKEVNPSLAQLIEAQWHIHASVK